MTKAAPTKARAGPQPESDGRQVHQYDKVLRENMEVVLPGLIKKLLGIYSVFTEELPDDVQHTKERKPDVLKKVTDSNGETFVLHIEFQVIDEPEMPLRMAEYYIMLSRRYKLPVRQYVIYLGKYSPQMKDHILSERMHFKYELITLSAVDYRLLLSAENPAEKMLAILADFGDRNAGHVVEIIVKEIIATSPGDFSKLRHIRQLRILANLRNFKSENLAIMDSVGEYMLKNKENDFLYLRGQKDGMEIGIERGLEKGKEKFAKEFVRYLLLNTKHTTAEIAGLVNVSAYFVRKVKKSLQ
ncbi:hypothetical protein [Puia dinghuensis]|uniref:Transposase (putative) YhgA-like domain-containing protein n=1 Tax=Puia dinghuensis TaxID=1792502 RepID=A0A8J2XSU7_9BACT|nr:hypothetical protein [Puia dinghuensis]GGA97972.1 hypothetical protein GCM10011511_21630 [Puia dinghuensis]